MKTYLLALLAGALSLSACSGGSNKPLPATDARPQDYAALAARCGQPAPAGQLNPTCQTPASADGLEPACNPHLAQSPWAASHRGNYAQASSPFPGVREPASANIAHTAITAAPIVIDFSEPDAQGHVAAWASTVGFTGEIVKFDAQTLALLERYTPPGAGSGGLSVSGAYNLLDRDQNLIVGKSQSLEVYGDATPGDHRSGIAQRHALTLPPAALCRDDDQLVGITMLHDGHVAFATKYGQVGVVPRYPEAMCSENIVSYSLNGAACADSSVDSDALEQVSNSIAADENGGIYVVSSNAQYRLDWNGRELTRSWRAEYGGAGGSGAGRLGAGSGSTPTLMGTRPADDQFVVITDGQELMHLTLFWRDAIPEGWQPIAPGKDRRIACELPITFGDESATHSLSEQSVLVRGYASVVVNNLMQGDALLSQVPAQLQPLTQLISGLGGNKPQGLERVDWNPVTRACTKVWANPDIAIPNGIPTMSTEGNLLYGIGSRSVDGVDTWTLEAVDFGSGQSVFSLASTILPSDNSFFAATTIGPDRSVWTGTFGGVTRFQDCPAGQACGQRPDPLAPVPLLP